MENVLCWGTKDFVNYLKYLKSVVAVYPWASHKSVIRGGSKEFVGVKCEKAKG